VCRRLNANPETRGIDVLMTSGLLTDEVEQEAQQAGAKKCLPKPIDLNAVLEYLGIAAQATV
jgi:CheY-like chemotaxis protein